MQDARPVLDPGAIHRDAGPGAARDEVVGGAFLHGEVRTRPLLLDQLGVVGGGRACDRHGGGLDGAGEGHQAGDQLVEPLAQHVVDAVGHHAAHGGEVDRDVPVPAEHELGGRAGVGDDRVAETVEVELLEHGGGQVAPEPGAGRVGARLPHQPRGELVGGRAALAGDEDGAARQPRPVEVRDRLAGHDRHREPVVELGERDELTAAAGVHGGHPQAAERDVGGAVGQVVHDPVPGVAGLGGHVETGVGEQPVLPRVVLG